MVRLTTHWFPRSIQESPVGNSLSLISIRTELKTNANYGYPIQTLTMEPRTMSLTELFCDIDERKPVHTLAKRLSGEFF